MIGTNNLSLMNKNEDVAKGIRTILDEFHKRLNGVKVLLLGIFPRLGPITENVKKVNEIIMKYDDGHSIRYLDMRKQFEDEKTKQIKAELYSDGLHLTKKGYDVWAQTMESLFNQMLNEGVQNSDKNNHNDDSSDSGNSSDSSDSSDSSGSNDSSDSSSSESNSSD